MSITEIIDALLQSPLAPLLTKEEMEQFAKNIWNRYSLPVPDVYSEREFLVEEI